MSEDNKKQTETQEKVPDHAKVLQFFVCALGADIREPFLACTVPQCRYRIPVDSANERKLQLHLVNAHTENQRIQQWIESENQQPPKRKRVNVHNISRAHVFRSFLVSTFGTNILSQGILDVAGGKGELAVPLCIAGYSTTIVDPKVSDFTNTRALKNLEFHLQRKNSKTYDSLPEIVKQNRTLPLPHICAEWFCCPATPEESFELALKKQMCTCVVGLHPDQATEPIVNFSLQHGKHFAVIPCCVFPNEAPHRMIKVGHGDLKPVRTYDDFLQYLQQKHPKINRMVLPFEGRNVVLFASPPY